MGRSDSADWLTLRAGPAARAALSEAPLTPERIAAVAAAAGGPKWLAIMAFHRFLFADWLAGRERLPVVGSSIGAWAGAMACHPSDPAGAIDALAEAYIGQSYATKPSPAEVTSQLADVLGTAMTPDVRRGVVEASRYRLHALTGRSRWLTGTDVRWPLGAGLMAAGLANTVSRSALGGFFERVVFSRDGDRLVWADDGLPTRVVALSQTNVFDAVFASGNVPLLMQGVRDPDGAPRGLYRDGGVLDYHIDQPLASGGSDAPIVLMPHFETQIVPGWFDSRLSWRARPRFADHTLLIGPGPAMREALMDGRVPDYRDFYRYAGDDATRHRAWRQAMTVGERMRDAFFDLVARDRLAEHVQPL